MAREVSVGAAAGALQISARRLRELCASGDVVGARRIGEGNRSTWSVPVNRAGRPQILDWPRKRGPKKKGAP